jgi:hypothetical protein
MVQGNDPQVKRSEVEFKKRWYRDARVWSLIGVSIAIGIAVYLGSSGLLDSWHPQNELDTPAEQL